MPEPREGRRRRESLGSYVMLSLGELAIVSGRDCPADSLSKQMTTELSAWYNGADDSCLLWRAWQYGRVSGVQKSRREARDEVIAARSRLCLKWAELAGQSIPATWPSGKARVCKTLITGSNPVVASNAERNTRRPSLGQRDGRRLIGTLHYLNVKAATKRPRIARHHPGAPPPHASNTTMSE